MPTHKITVNANGLRIKALFAYDRLTRKLNESIAESKKEYNDNMVRIEPEMIQSEMDELRMLIGAIAGLSIEGDEDFKDVFNAASVGDHDLVCFNEEEEVEHE